MAFDDISWPALYHISKQFKRFINVTNVVIIAFVVAAVFVVATPNVSKMIRAEDSVGIFSLGENHPGEK